MAEKIIVEIEEDFEELIPTYLENRWKDVEDIRNAIKHGDWQPLLRIGHGMKGSGGGYGFDLITEIGAIIEKAAKNKQTDPILSSVEHLIDYLERVECKFVPVEDY